MNQRFTPQVWLVFLFTISYLAGAIPFAKSQSNQEFALYITVTAILVAIVGVIHSRVGLTTTLLLGMSVWGFLHMAGGLAQIPQAWPREGDEVVLYNWWLVPNHLKYDQAVHAYGFGMTTWLCWQGLRKILAAQSGKLPSQIIPTAGTLTLAAAAGMGFGALNEVVEFTATLLVPDTNVGGYENTGWDLVFNAGGCILAALLIRLRNDNIKL